MFGSKIIDFRDIAAKTSAKRSGCAPGEGGRMVQRRLGFRLLLGFVSAVFIFCLFFNSRTLSLPTRGAKRADDLMKHEMVKYLV